MAQKVIKVGNSAAITLSQSVLDALGVSVGDQVQLNVDQRTKRVFFDSKPAAKEMPVDEELYSWTKRFIETYRKDLEELADK